LRRSRTSCTADAGDNRLWTGSGTLRDYNRPESLAAAYAGLDRLLIITTVDAEPGKHGAQNVAAIDAAVKAGVKHDLSLKKMDNIE
jgi:uncharacterized protein YbjT (DUF2867 family)